MAQNIYFDESGFTGNNLLHPQQKFFAYASVATDDDEAQEFVRRSIRTHRIQGSELKGGRLVRHAPGRRVIDDALCQFEGRIKVTVSDKKYALACKFFEYIFEPALSSINSLFYGINFHRFVANLLYMEFTVRGARAEQIFADFEALMRGRSEDELARLFASSSEELSPYIRQIVEFAQARAEDIRREMRDAEEAGLASWILDLTTTCLFTQLGSWGQEFDQVTAICDASKPLANGSPLFDVMINRPDRVFSEAFGEPHPITFNLSGPLQLVDSAQHAGIQIADLFAAMAVEAVGGDSTHARRWREQLATFGNYGSLFPDFSVIDLDDWRAVRNTVVLMNLHERATSGVSLTDGMGEFIQIATIAARRFPVPSP